MKLDSLQLEWLGHAAFKIKVPPKIVYIDPYQLTQKEKADMILITHSHYDHCSLADIEKIIKEGTTIVCTPDCQSTIARLKEKVNLMLVEPGKELSFENVKIKTVPSYNQNKKFHPKSERYVGYVLQFKNVVIYHAGDTDLIKEMQDLTGYGKKGNIFVALLPVGGTYTMNAEEAAKAASLIKPSITIPMHYGSIVGSRKDAENFCNLCKEKGIRAEILEKS
ncbi:MAG: MBL fold metallo-hydrolase [Candidatus Pacearchaeota archaeon]